MNKALIISIISKEYRILLEDGRTVKAILSGKMRLNDYPVVGDYVLYQEIDGLFVIQDILPRRNYMVRPNLANVDQMIIMMSLKDPDFSYELVNRLIILIENSDIEPIICISKADLGSTKEINEIRQFYESMNYRVYSCQKDFDVIFFEPLLKDKISVLCGQSGVGKSTLLNNLNPELNLRTNEISKALNRGKHTTRHVELYHMFGGYLADTPGFSSIDLSNLNKDSIAAHLTAFKPFLNQCYFNNCLHLNEPNCAIKQAVKENKIQEAFYNTYVDVMNFIIEGNFKANRHRTLK